MATSSRCTSSQLTRISAAAAACALLVTACSDGRSVEAYCAELDEGFSRMSGNVEAAGDGGLDQFMAALQNVSETERLLGRLAEVAPEEIEPDVRAVAEGWSRQGEQLGRAASDPIGGFVSILTNSVMMSASVDEVERWTQQNCGMPLFGSPDRVLAAAGDSEGGAVVDQPRCPALREPLRRDSDAAELLEALDGADEDGITEVRDLASRLEAVGPEARTAWDALGRLLWDGGGDPAAAVEAVDEAVLRECGRPFVDEAFLDGFEEMGPRPLDDGRVLVGTYDRACSTGSWQGFWRSSQQPYAVDGRLVVHCDATPDGDPLALARVDLTTGEVVFHPVPAGNAWAGGPGQGTWPWYTDGWVYWVEVETLPASGLQPPYDRGELFRAPLGEPTAVELLLDVEHEDGVGISILAAHDGSIAARTWTPDDDTSLQLISDGSVAPLAAPASVSNPVFLWPGMVQSSYLAVDLVTESVTELHDPDFRRLDDPSLSGPGYWRDACTGRRFEHADNARERLVRWQLGPGRTLSSTSLPITGRVPRGVVVPLADGMFAMPPRSFSGTYAHYGPTGEERWQLPDGVVDRAQVFDDVLYVVTTTDELIAVDTETGGEGTPDPDVVPVVRALLDGASLRIDPSTGDAQLRSGDVIEFLRLPQCAVAG